MGMELQGKTVVVTGASKGIGKSIAEVFAAEGANLVLTARGATALDETVSGIVANGGNAIGVVSDVQDPDGPRLVFGAAIDAFGGVDVLVNNAGVGEMRSIEETTDEQLLEVLNTNFVSAFRYCREAVQHFIPKSDGVIVNVTSVNANKPVCGASYTSSKGALATLTKNIAIRFAGTGIRCNALAPGVTETEMTNQWDTAETAGSRTMWPYNESFANLSLPRTQPVDQAYAALYLASDRSRATTGQTLQVCSGSFL